LTRHTCQDHFYRILRHELEAVDFYDFNKWGLCRIGINQIPELGFRCDIEECHEIAQFQLVAELIPNPGEKK
jgi:hypothetical protein